MDEPLTDTNSLMPSADYADKPDCIILEPNTEYIASITHLSDSNSTFNAASGLYKIQTFRIAKDDFLETIIIAIPSAVVNTYLGTILTKIHSGYMNTTN